VIGGKRVPKGKGAPRKPSSKKRLGKVTRALAILACDVKTPTARHGNWAWQRDEKKYARRANFLKVSFGRKTRAMFVMQEETGCEIPSRLTTDQKGWGKKPEFQGQNALRPGSI